MGNWKTLTLEANERIKQAELLIGAKRLVQPFSHIPTKISYQPEEIEQIVKTTDAKEIVILMSGDTGFYSGTKKLLCHLREWEVKIYPGISSISYLAAQIGMSWEDAKILSLHGREENLEEALFQYDKVFLLTAGKIDQLCQRLTLHGFGAYDIYVGERLSYPEERITIAKVNEMQQFQFDPLACCFLIANGQKRRRASFGLAEEWFIRGKVPITKSEVRAVTMSKLSLKKTDIVYDIGAGTGSVSVEMAIAACLGKVYAVECQEEAQQLIEQNKQKFQLENLELVKGMAPDVIHSLPKPDVAFLGGTKGNMESIITVLQEKNPMIHLVMNAITLETVCQALEILKKLDFKKIELVQVFPARAKQAGNYHMMTALNPVFLITADGTVDG